MNNFTIYMGITEWSTADFMADLKSTHMISYIRLIHNTIISSIVKKLEGILCDLLTILPYMGITEWSRVDFMADLKSPQVISYMCSIHSNIISSILKKLEGILCNLLTILPYMGITEQTRADFMADLKSAHVISYMCSIDLNVISSQLKKLEGILCNLGTILPYMVITEGSRADFIADLKSTHVISYMHSIHSNVISSILKQLEGILCNLWTILPYIWA